MLNDIIGGNAHATLSSEKFFRGKCSNEARSMKVYVPSQRTTLCRNQFYKSK